MPASSRQLCGGCGKIAPAHSSEDHKLAVGYYYYSTMAPGRVKEGKLVYFSFYSLTFLSIQNAHRKMFRERLFCFYA